MYLSFSGAPLAELERRSPAGRSLLGVAYGIDAASSETTLRELSLSVIDRRRGRPVERFLRTWRVDAP